MTHRLDLGDSRLDRFVVYRVRVVIAYLMCGVAPVVSTFILEKKKRSIASNRSLQVVPI